MFASLMRRPAAVPASAMPVAGRGPDLHAAEGGPDLRSAVKSIGEMASGIGREAAEARGQLEDTHQASQRQAQSMLALGTQLREVVQAQEEIATVSQQGLDAVDRVRDAVAAVGQEVTAAVGTLHAVSAAASGITQIALQTRLVAFNASVEAKRAGDAGRGFGIVADAVKTLASQVEASSKDILRTVAELNARIDSLARDIRVDSAGGAGAPASSAGSAEPGGAVQRALADVRAGVGNVSAAAVRSRGVCGALDTRLQAIEGEIQHTGRALEAAAGRSEGFLQVSERLIELVAHCGIATADTPFIAAAQDAAGQIAQRLEAALRSRLISAEALFDEAYRPLPDTAPVKHLTRFTELADRLFPEVQEAVLKLDEKIVYCIAVDRNGYIPTHNRQYAQPQRGDLAWDTANSRHRRIFTDRTSLASARNRKPFLLQTYRRDMGGGRFIVLKEAAAPITVDGRHWGGIRLAFQF